MLNTINVITQAAAITQAAVKSSGSTSPYSVTVTDGDSPATSAGTPTQTLPRAAAQQITLTCVAEDPAGDRLVYNVYFRGEDESQWKLLRSNTHDNSITFDADVLADGKYFFRVIASDREANPPASAREATLVSSPVMIDNTPPILTLGEVRRTGATAHVEKDMGAVPRRHIAKLTVTSVKRRWNGRRCDRFPARKFARSEQSLPESTSW